jgi:hypothetical protein
LFANHHPFCDFVIPVGTSDQLELPVFQLTISSPAAYRAGMGNPTTCKDQRLSNRLSGRVYVGVLVLLAALALAGLWLRSYRWGDQIVAAGLTTISGDGAVSFRIKADDDVPVWGVFAGRHQSDIHEGIEIYYSLIVVPLVVVAAFILWKPICENWLIAHRPN